MSDSIDNLRLVQDAFARPTLQLLSTNWAPVQVAIFRTLFDRDRRTVATDTLHGQVAALCDQFQSEGFRTPTGSGRELCRQWMRHKWLVRLPSADGEVYELTSHALEALELVQNLRADRPLLSESRLAAIIDTVRRQAIEASPDAGSKIERLNAQIAELAIERDRLVAGGTPEPASQDRMMEGYENLVDLIGQLPSDFKRVEEGISGLRGTILADFRSESRPLGLIIDEYLARSDDLLVTPEGRAFAGALRLLRDDTMLMQLRRDLEMILSHPFTEVLTGDEVRAFRGTVTMVRRGLDDVLAQRGRVTSTLRQHVVNHDAVKERELATTLRSIHTELSNWIPTSPVRARIPVALVPGTIGVLPHVRERFYDPSDHLPPEPLTVDENEPAGGPTLQQIRQLGGPLLARLRSELAAAAELPDPTTVGGAFNTFPDDLRRPVEVLGVLHLLSRIGALDALDDNSNHEHVETVRPDGSRRTLRLPVVQLTPHRESNFADMELE